MYIEQCGCQNDKGKFILGIPVSHSSKQFAVSPNSGDCNAAYWRFISIQWPWLIIIFHLLLFCIRRRNFHAIFEKL